MEPTEIQEFSKQLKEAGEGESLTSISLGISILAVLVAMVTVLGHRTHTEAVLQQGRATDQWNEYQAKKIREDNLTVVMDTLSLSPASPALDRKLAEYEGRVARWKADMAESQHTARELEAEVATAERKAGRYDLGEALLQIAVVLSSITLLTRKRSYFIFGLSLGMAGLLIAASALILRG